MDENFYDTKWTKVYENGGNIADIMTNQINEFFETEE
jgi:hypothetical protein